MKQSQSSLSDLRSKVSQVADIYAERFAINRDDLWYLAKISEEAGELTAAYLKNSSRGRVGEQSNEKLRQNLEFEAADLLAHLLLFCDHNNIDVEAALERKWFSRL